MSTQTLHISTFDKERLERRIERVLTDAERNTRHTEAPYARLLHAELGKARLVAPQEMPPDVITMNTTFVLENIDTAKESTYTLAFPAESDPGEGRLSVFAPVGIALLGCRVGDVVEWPVPKGVCHYRVKAITFQPEAEGDFTR